MKRQVFYIVFIFLTIPAIPQKMTVITPDHTKIELTIVAATAKEKLLQDFDGKQDDDLRKAWTARTWRLSDQRLLIEFYDRQAALVNTVSDFEQLKQVRFVKNYIDFLKKNISYKIELSFEQGREISQIAKKRLGDLIPEMPQYNDFEVYELNTGQVLCLTTSGQRSAAIYENMKTLCAHNDEVLHQYYKGMEEWTEKLVNGDPLRDFERNEQMVYPKDIPRLQENHKLVLIESKIYVAGFYGNLYQSEAGYYILIDEVKQKNGTGDRMPILTVRVYESLEEVRKAQAKYEKRKREGVNSEHFYKKISDQYGKEFPSRTMELINTLPQILNIDKSQLTFDSAGMAVADEAIHWNHADYTLFNKWFPGILAYYGQCYMKEKKQGKWVVKKDKEDDVLVPHLMLPGNEDAFDVYEFYKSLLEWPIPLAIAGDWDSSTARMLKKMK